VQAARASAGGGKATARPQDLFIELFESMRAATASLPLPEAVDHANGASGLSRITKKERDGQGPALDNLAELVNAAQSFLREADLAVDALIALPDSADAAEAEGAADPLTAFLAHASLEAGETQAAEPARAASSATVHAAKGLRFHTVFWSRGSGGTVSHEQQSLKRVRRRRGERRPCTLALTRAKRAVHRARTKPDAARAGPLNIASRFLDELPREVVSWLSPRRQRRSAIDVDPSEWGDRVGAITPTSNAPATAPGALDRGPGWQIGQSVRHAKFGLGIIIDAEGRGGDARVQVNFRDTGVKWLALEYAKLEAA
jgi:DNA helicase-2/ATP-dependent DNA helicase PcrA